MALRWQFWVYGLRVTPRGRAVARTRWLALLLVLPVAWLAGCEEANEAPVASFTAAPGAGHRSLEVAFDATTSSDADSAIQSYSWDFGDGQTGTGQAIQYTYEADRDTPPVIYGAGSGELGTSGLDNLQDR